MKMGVHSGKRAAIGLIIAACIVSVSIADCVDISNDKVEEFDPHTPDVMHLVEGDDGLLIFFFHDCSFVVQLLIFVLCVTAVFVKGTTMMRLARPPSLPFNYTHLYLRCKCANCGSGIAQVKVVTQKAEPIHGISWGNCPAVSFQGTGEILSEQTEELCMKGLRYWQIPLSKPIVVYDPYIYIGITLVSLPEDNTVITTPFLSLSRAAESQCWPNYMKLENGTMSFIKASIPFAFNGSSFERLLFRLSCMSSFFSPLLLQQLLRRS